MNNIKIRFLKNIFLYLSFFISLNACDNHSLSVSENIQESKEIGVFIHEYQIKNIETIKHDFCFPVQAAWLELTWFEDLTEINPVPGPMIDSTSCPKIVFKLKDKQEMDFLFEDNYAIIWSLIDESGYTAGYIGSGSVSKQSFNSCKCKMGTDSIPYTIYLCPHYFSDEGLIPVFRFDLVKKEE
jgi:hypothetical protein